MIVLSYNGYFFVQLQVVICFLIYLAEYFFVPDFLLLHSVIHDIFFFIFKKIVNILLLVELFGNHYFYNCKWSERVSTNRFKEDKCKKVDLEDWCQKNRNSKWLMLTSLKNHRFQNPYHYILIWVDQTRGLRHLV